MHLPVKFVALAILASSALAEGTYPTPHGIIKVRHERQPDGTINSTIETPPGVDLVE